MSDSHRAALLCRYQYDPKDRLAGNTLFEQTNIWRFYCESRFSTEVEGALHTSVFQHDDQLLALQKHSIGKGGAALLATDQQRSVLCALDNTRLNPMAYMPYGHRPNGSGLPSLLGFNGERPDPVTGHYHLGNGYRQFNPMLMRFNSPDSWSPFGTGGMNAYAYCVGDPINKIELNGHSSIFVKFLKGVGNRLGFRKPSTLTKAAPTANQTRQRPQRTAPITPKQINSSALDNAKDFDLNNLTLEELNLNYGQRTVIKPLNNRPVETLEYPLRVNHIEDPVKKLANLQQAEINTSQRILSDSPQTARKRQFMLDNLRNDIAVLADQIRESYPTRNI